MKTYKMYIGEHDSGKSIAMHQFWYNKLLEIFKDTARFGYIRINDISLKFSWYSFSEDRTMLFLSGENEKPVAIIHLEHIVSVE